MNLHLYRVRWFPGQKRLLREKLTQLQNIWPKTIPEGSVDALQKVTGGADPCRIREHLNQVLCGEGMQVLRC
ncbi:hypothetical protein DC3_23980 [Deinococcus cellulosilyticus NBRC 106333 = KACC 11606]|uniref:Uncharacterized protein n=1 Tax=Deinococcus cellulosilyticus (strain DSM 18568 / NBRC 106333 / KACC 11606 / 5516J-15) TaxID=1223518 RepID=A0A511N1L4_DEIC1|nr:hypothetical protein DC3_23980 [Deinococcus cellulosilyticus NBRC 106333 = KACC 11606]